MFTFILNTDTSIIPSPGLNGVALFADGLGNNLPIAFGEFTIRAPSETCSVIHYAASEGGSVSSYTGVEIIGGPGGCLFGPFLDIPVTEIFGVQENDSDFDGLPDSVETEIGTGTDPSQADSDGNGTISGRKVSA